MFVASSVTYIRQDGILLLSHFCLTYTHLRDFVMFVASLITYIRQGEILLLSHFLFKSWLDLLIQRHWLNSSFIKFRNGYNHLVHLLLILLQVLNVPWPREPLSVYGFQVITALPRIVDNSVRSFPCGAKLSLGRVFSRSGNLAQDKIDRLCQVIWALPFYCSIRPSSADTSSFCWKLYPLLRPGNPGWFAGDCHCFLRGIPFAWCWLLLLRPGSLIQCHRWAWRGSLSSGFLPWFCKPTGRRAILRAMHPSHCLAWLWWSWAVSDSSLPTVHLLGMRIGF